MKKISIFILMFNTLVCNSIAQQVSFTGKVVNPDENPIKNVLVYLANNPSIFCRSDSLGNFSLIEQISTSVNEIRQERIITFENQELLLYADNQDISVDIYSIDGRKVMNILNLNRSLGTVGLYPAAYISNLPKAIYIVMAMVGNTFQSFKIQNVIPTSLPKGITLCDINNTIENSFTEPKSEPNIETKSETLDTLVLVHDFYKSRKIPLDSYSIQYDTIHLNNFADYSIAEGFEPAVTYWYNGYGNFTSIFSSDSVWFIIDYDTLSILKGDLKVITIPVAKIEGLDNSIEFISGLHCEPSGTRLFQSAQVYLSMKDTIPDGLVVFHYNDQGETYFIPHKDLNSRSITFYINHFSSIGIGISDIHPPTDNPEEFTTSDQFLSYIDEYLRYSETIGEFSPPPIELFAVWYNNVVVPMISSIITWEDFGAALDEFLLVAETCAQFAMIYSFTDLPFWDSAREMFSDEMMKIWNACVVEYNGLNNTCLKRATSDIALQILELNAVMGGTFCPDLNNFSALNALGNGEALNLVSEIEFSTPIKDLEPDSSYFVLYTLKCPSGKCLTEKVNWFSSDPSVATINDEGLIIALKKGITVIKAKICDVENTFKLEVGYNCEEYYCRNEDDSCYSGIYHCSGITTHTHKGQYLGSGPWVDESIIYYTMVGELGNQPGYYEEYIIQNVENKPSISGSQNYFKIDYDRIYIKGAFHCGGTNYFWYWPYTTFPTNEGHFRDGLLTFDVEYPSGDEGMKTTKFFCH